MKKIGFIDLFIDEWHANNYPAWIREDALKDEFELSHAWQAEQRPGLRTLEQWCKDFQMIPAGSQEEVIEKCDAIFVLAPANPEVHESLADLSLQSGKPLYIDKPFSDSTAAAERIFAKAEQFHTPLMTSSALRFGNEIIAARQKLPPETISYVNTRGGGRSYEEYGIHQLEMIQSLMPGKVVRLMQCGSGKTTHLVMEYEDGRRASLTLDLYFGFDFAAAAGDKSIVSANNGQTFVNLLHEILLFFKTGVNPIPRSQTLEIVRILEASVKAQSTPDQWVTL